METQEVVAIQEPAWGEADIQAALLSGKWTLERIRLRQEEMWATLEGCDWCCGGGDDEMAFLNALSEALAS